MRIKRREMNGNERREKEETPRRLLTITPDVSRRLSVNHFRLYGVGMVVVKFEVHLTTEI